MEQNNCKSLGLIKKWKIANPLLTDSPLILQNPFEFPRQQEDQASRLELMHFTVSQILLNPNQLDGNNQIRSIPVTIMEVPTIVEALKATTVMGSQKEALSYLDEASKMIGFLPLLAEISVNQEIEIPVRQAAIIFFKNGIQRGWVVDEEDEKDATPVSEQDKSVIRTKIVPQIVFAPPPIRVHFCTALQNILRCDYPEKWPDFPHLVAALLHIEDANSWLSAFNVSHRLTKVYEYRRQQEKQPMYDFMATVLPLIYVRFQTLVATGTEESAVLEHYILKIFYCLTQFSMNTDLINIETFGHWISQLVRILERPIPSNISERDEEDQAETMSWKCKKWAIKIITKLFDRYGAKGQVEKSYLPYADYYFEHFALPIVNCVLHILQDYASKKFVTERYVFFALSHLADALGHAEIWKVVKPHFNNLVLHVIFPSLCYTDEDEELWETEELDFIRQRHDYFDELHSPSAAAANVLQAGLKRKGVLEEMLQHFINVLNDPNSPIRQVDGALHVLANLMPKLATSRKFKKDVEKLVHMHIIPRLHHENKFIRLHAAFCMKMCDQVSFKHENILKESIEGLMGRIGNGEELLAIKIEAGIAINAILDEQADKAAKYIRPHVRSLLTELFRLLTQTSLDELTNITDSIIETFPEEVIPVAVEVATEIHNLFVKYANQHHDESDAVDEGDAGGEDEEDKTITMIGLLSTLQTLLDLVDDNPEISSKLEPVVFNIVHTIYTSDAFDFFEDAVSLVESVIVKHISDKAWEFYPMIRQKFDMSGPSQYPTLNDYMSCLHSYLTVDTEKFLSLPERSIWMLEMCEATLKNFELDADAHVHAAKLLECFILQCPGRINEFIPNILQVAMNRLQAGHFEETNNELVPQLLVVLIAAMHYNFELFVQSLPSLQPFGMETVQWLFAEIFANKEHIEGIHNRKMILYAICLMLRLPHEHQPPAIANDPKVVASYCLELFDGIDKCLKAIAERKKEDMESSDDDDDDSETDDEHPNRTIDDELRDSDDDIDEGTLEYLEHLNKEEKKESRKRDGTAMTNGNPAEGDGFRSDSEDSEGFHMFQDETDIESYITPIDDEENGLNVYIEFKKSLETLQGNSPAQFTQLTHLQGDEAESLKKLFELCVQQENLMKSLALKKSGGCEFDAAAKVPTSFDFS